jgi:hypothetical protein
MLVMRFMLMPGGIMGVSKAPSLLRRGAFAPAPPATRFSSVARPPGIGQRPDFALRLCPHSVGDLPPRVNSPFEEANFFRLEDLKSQGESAPNARKLSDSVCYWCERGSRHPDSRSGRALDHGGCLFLPAAAGGHLSTLPPTCPRTHPRDAKTRPQRPGLSNLFSR